jgi:hypothetical protein
VFAADCDGFPDEEELTCPECGGEYGECPCPGPTQDDIYEYAEFGGIMYARPIAGLGRDAARLPHRLDGRWPAPPGPQFPWEPPRVATGVPNRAARLKALGNAVVPAQAAPLFRAIMDAERRRE